jgi:two-component system, LytTR family, response regulator
MKAILMDDEPDAIIVLQILLKEQFNDLIEVVGTANNVIEGIKLANKVKPDIVFLDIELPHTNGFEFTEIFSKREFSIVFVTAFPDYAIQAIRAKVDDYLIKPVDVDELSEVIHRLFEGKKENRMKSNPAPKIKLITHECTLFVSPEELIVIKAEGRYSNVYLTENRKILITKNIGDFESELLPMGFQRVHKSFLVNFSHILQINNRDGGFLELSNGMSIEISRRNRKKVRDWLGNGSTER